MNLNDDLRKGVRNSLDEAVKDGHILSAGGAGNHWLLDFEGKQQPTESGQKPFKVAW
jgi:hypothetical protein